MTATYKFRVKREPDGLVAEWEIDLEIGSIYNREMDKLMVEIEMAINQSGTLRAHIDRTK